MKEILFDIYAWTITEGEYIFGLPLGIAIVQPLNFGNEFLHFCFQIVGTITGAYLIHRMKKYWAKHR